MNNDFWKNFGAAMEQIFGVPTQPPVAPPTKPPISADARAFAEQLNKYLEHTRSVRIRGALTRPDMDVRGEPAPGWNRSVETMPVPKNSIIGQVLIQCLESENYYTRFTNSIFCGWTVQSEGPAVWQFRQTIYFKQPTV